MSADWCTIFRVLDHYLGSTPLRGVGLYSRFEKRGFSPSFFYNTMLSTLLLIITAVILNIILPINAKATIDHPITIKSQVCLDQECREKATCLIDWRNYYLNYTIKNDSITNKKACVAVTTGSIETSEEVILKDEITTGNILISFNKDNDYGVIRTYLYEESCLNGKLLAVAGDHNLPALEDKELEIEKLKLDDNDIYIGNAIKLHAEVIGQQRNERAELKYNCSIIINNKIYKLPDDKCKDLLKGRKIEVKPDVLGIQKSGEYKLTLVIEGSLKNKDYSQLDSWCKNILGARKSVNLVVRVPTEAKLKASKDVYDFGKVSVGNYRDLTVKITNLGEGSTSIKHIRLENNRENAFSIIDNKCENRIVESNESCQLKIRFSPSEITQYNSSIIVEYNDYEELKISIKGTGKGIASIQALPLKLAFENTEVNSFSEKELTIKNSGNVGIAIKKIQNTNLAFYIYENRCENRVLNPSESCTLAVRFEPTLEKEYDDSIKIEYVPIDNTEDVHLLDVPVTGTGYYSNSPPTLEIKNKPSKGSIGEPITFTFIISDKDGNLSNIDIDCNGDGTTDNSKIFSPNTKHTEVSLTCTYNSSGTYTWTATAYDTSGAKSQIQDSISIENSNHSPTSKANIPDWNVNIPTSVLNQNAVYKLHSKDDKYSIELSLKYNASLTPPKVHIFLSEPSDEFCKALITNDPDISNIPKYNLTAITKDIEHNCYKSDENQIDCYYTINIDHSWNAGKYDIILETADKNLLLGSFQIQKPIDTTIIYQHREEAEFASSFTGITYSMFLAGDIKESFSEEQAIGYSCELLDRRIRDITVLSCSATGAALGYLVAAGATDGTALPATPLIADETAQWAAFACDLLYNYSDQFKEIVITAYYLSKHLTNYFELQSESEARKKNRALEKTTVYSTIMSSWDLLQLCTYIQEKPTYNENELDLTKCIRSLSRKIQAPIVVLQDKLSKSYFNNPTCSYYRPVYVFAPDIPIDKISDYLSDYSADIEFYAQDKVKIDLKETISYFLLVSPKPIIAISTPSTSWSSLYRLEKLLNQYSFLNKLHVPPYKTVVLPNFQNLLEARNFCKKTDLCRIEAIYVPFHGFISLDTLISEISNNPDADNLADIYKDAASVYLLNPNIPVIALYTTKYQNLTIQNLPITVETSDDLRTFSQEIPQENIEGIYITQTYLVIFFKDNGKERVNFFDLHTGRLDLSLPYEENSEVIKNTFKNTQETRGIPEILAKITFNAPKKIASISRKFLSHVYSHFPPSKLDKIENFQKITKDELKNNNKLREIINSKLDYIKRKISSKINNIQNDDLLDAIEILKYKTDSFNLFILTPKSKPPKDEKALEIWKEIIKHPEEAHRFGLNPFYHFKGKKKYGMLKRKKRLIEALVLPNVNIKGQIKTITEDKYLQPLLKIMLDKLKEKGQQASSILNGGRLEVHIDSNLLNNLPEDLKKRLKMLKVLKIDKLNGKVEELDIIKNLQVKGKVKLIATFNSEVLKSLYLEVNP